MVEYDPGYYANARTDIEPLIPSGVSSVLELGCGEGNTLWWLRQHFGVSVCHGVELIDEIAVRAREKGLEVMSANIEADGIPFEREYDLVLCLDVLEHLRDPWDVMKEITARIRPGGHLIASIPNVAHISVFVSLLGDQWTYSPAGILDRTHLRFFTAVSARQLLINAGLEEVRHLPRFGRKTHRRVDWLTVGLFRRFLTLQNLFLVRRPL